MGAEAQHKLGETVPLGPHHGSEGEEVWRAHTAVGANPHDAAEDGESDQLGHSSVSALAPEMHGANNGMRGFSVQTDFSLADGISSHEAPDVVETIAPMTSTAKAEHEEEPDSPQSATSRACPLHLSL